MKHTKKFLALVLSLAVVASLAAAGTLAFLSGQTGTVTNKFQSVGADTGAIGVKLDEADPTTENPDNRTETGRTYTNVVPNAELDKDPTVHILKTSVDCYVYASVKNELSAYIDVGEINAAWVEVGEANGAKIYRYNTKVEAQNAPDENTTTIGGKAYVDLPAIFTKVNVKNLDNSIIETLNTEAGSILVRAYAIQADGMEKDTVAATTALNGFFGDITVNAGAALLPVSAAPAA